MCCEPLVRAPNKPMVLAVRNASLRSAQRPAAHRPAVRRRGPDGAPLAVHNGAVQVRGWLDSLKE